MRPNTLLLFVAGSLLLQACPKTPPQSSGDSVLPSDGSDEPQETVTFRDRELPAGTKVRVVESMMLAADLTGSSPQAGEVFQARMARKDYTAMEASVQSNDAGERDVILRYEESWSQEGDGPRRGPLLDAEGRIAPGFSDAFEVVEYPKNGKSYRARWTPDEGGTVHFFDEREEGSLPGVSMPSPNDSEAKEVLTDAHRLLDLGIDSPSEIGSLFDGKSIRVGETLSLSGDEMAGLLGEIEKDMTFRNLLLTLSRLDERGGVRCAIWTFTVEGQMTDDWIQGNMGLEGEFVVSIDGLDVHQMSMWGPFNFKGIDRNEGGEVVVEGAGRVQGTQVLTYSFSSPETTGPPTPSPPAGDSGANGTSSN